MRNIRCIGLWRMSNFCDRVGFSSLFIRYCGRRASGSRMMKSTVTDLLRFLVDSDGRHDSSPQAVYEVKTACSILYLLLVNEADESFKDKLRIPEYT